MSRPASSPAIGKNPIVATDADIAGRVAAERDFWILTPYRLDPRYAPLPEGSDPADLLALNGPAALTTVLDQARPLGDELINERLTSLPPEQAQLEAARVVAARPPGCWDQGSNTISSRLKVPLDAVRQTLLAHVKDWNGDPRRAAIKPLQGVNDVKRRLTGAAQIRPEQRWAALAGQLDQRLLRQGDWPALAQLMQKIHDQGHDVAALTRAVTRTPLNDLPAQDLRYRLAAHLDFGVDTASALSRHPYRRDHDTSWTAPDSSCLVRGNANAFSLIQCLSCSRKRLRRPHEDDQHKNRVLSRCRRGGAHRALAALLVSWPGGTLPPSAGSVGKNRRAEPGRLPSLVATFRAALALLIIELLPGSGRY